MGFASLNPSYARPRSALEIGRRLTSDPNRSSLGLLPSGPDPVGEWPVHRQPPGPLYRRNRTRLQAAEPDGAGTLASFVALSEQICSPRPKDRSK